MVRIVGAGLRPMKRDLLPRFVCFIAGILVATICFSLLAPFPRAASTNIGNGVVSAVPVRPQQSAEFKAHDAERANAATEGADWRSRYEALPSADDKIAFLTDLCAKVDPARAAELAEQVALLPAGTARELAMGVLVERLAAADPRRALALARSNLSGPARNNAVSAVAETWGQRSLPDLLAWVSTAVADPNAGQILEMGVVGAARSNPQAAAALLQSGNVPINPDLLSLGRNALLGVWAQSDPQAAVAEGRRMLSESGELQPLQTALLNWAASDPLSAANAALSAGSPSDDLATQIASSWAAQSPADAARWAIAIPSGFGRRGEMMREVAGAWARTDAAGAMNWAASVPRADADRATAIREITMNWSRFDEAGLAQFRNSAPPDLRADIDAARQAGR